MYRDFFDWFLKVSFCVLGLKETGFCVLGLKETGVSYTINYYKLVS